MITSCSSLLKNKMSKVRRLRTAGPYGFNDMSFDIMLPSNRKVLASAFLTFLKSENGLTHGIKIDPQAIGLSLCSGIPDVVPTSGGSSFVNGK